MRREIGKREIPTLFTRRSINNLNLSDFNYIKQVDGQIRLRETRLVLYGELELRNRLLQENHERIAKQKKKLIEQDKREVMNCLCNKKLIPQP